MKVGGFMKDAVILFVITLVAGISLGGVYEVTKAPIAKAQIEANKRAYRTVFPDAADFKNTDELTAAVQSSADALASQSFGNVVVYDALEAVDGSGGLLGHVITSSSKDGFGGEVKISVGVDKDKAVTSIAFLSLAETPGLGMNATDPEFKDQFNGKKAEAFSVTKTGASSDSEINAMSGATITSSAVTNAVNAAVYFINNCAAK